jgi:immune inhibitor A
MPRIIIALVSLVILMSAIAQAVMPPAPPEWYARKGIPVPEGIKRGMPPIPKEIPTYLAEAARLRPNNVDRILVILVQFPDHAANTVLHPVEAYDTMMFSVGAMPTGSMVEYYQEISYGAFTPEGVVTAWVTAPHEYSYYVGYNYGMGEYPNNSQGLLEDCVTMLDPTIDFSQFDNNGDGYAEGIFLVHAGQGAEETGSYNDIWSHAWGYYMMTNDGVSTGRYSIEPEELAGEEMIKIGVFCHEYGHVLGLPDLYDYDGSSEGIGVYCLMAGGSWGALPGNPERPTHMCAEMKRWLGWMTPIEVTTNLDKLAIPPAETDPVCYQITNPSYPEEYFLLENRAKIGFDSLFRGDGGLAIWHVDQNGWQDDETHPYVALEQADGNFDLMRDMGGGNSHLRTNRGDAGDLYPGACGNTRFSYFSQPNNRCYDGVTDLVTLDNIAQTNDTIYIDLYSSPDVPLFQVTTAVFDTVNIGLHSNRNGDADSAETVDLGLTLACDGVGASSLTGTLSTADTRVNIITGSVSLGAIAHGIRRAGDHPFRFAVTSGNADSAVTFTLQLNADGAIQNLPLKVNINRQKVLVVLDNNHSHWSDNLLAAMGRSGYSFDVLRVAPDSTLPYDTLIPYHAILWTSGSYFGTRTAGGSYPLCLTAADRAVLQQYLNQSGRLGLFSQDYLYDNGLDAFASTYLKVGLQYQDILTTSVTGEAGGAFAGYSGTTRPWSYYDYTDHLVPAAGAAVMVNDAGSGQAVVIQTPATQPVTTSFASTFSGLGIERLDSASLDNFLPRWLGWILTNTYLDVPWAISPRNNDTVAIGKPRLRWTSSYGATSYQMQIAAATDFEFTSPIHDYTVPDTGYTIPDSLPDGAYFWRVNARAGMAPATAYSPRARFVVKYSQTYMCGDANGDKKMTVGDAIYIISYIFRGGPAPVPLGAADANCDGKINSGDAVYIVSYIFRSGPAPCCP